MSETEIPEDIATLARRIGKQFKSEKDLADFSRLLKKMTVEAALGAELDEHLGYAKHEARGRRTGNSRNGYSSKTLKGAHGEVELETPRDRNGTFEPQLPPQHRGRFGGIRWIRESGPSFSHHDRRFPTPSFLRI